MNEACTHRAQLRARGLLEAASDAAGEKGPGFDIVAIDAGEGNGWQFTPECLRASLALWDGVPCYLDHHPRGASLHDLAGVCAAPRWDESTRAIHMTLQPFGPAANLLLRLGLDLLKNPAGPAGRRVGFSADVYFTANGRCVERILKVSSVDLVLNPARGGRFVSRSDRQTEISDPTEMEETMQEQLKTNPSDEAVAQRSLQAAEQQTCVEPPADLETTLAQARLPQVVTERLRAQFAGRGVQRAELEQAVADARELVSALCGPTTVQGPGGRVNAMFSSEDQLQAAVDDLFGVQRTQGLEAAQPARLSGIRELYLMLTGDDDLHGGYYPGRVRLSTTADFTGLVKNALNKIVVNTWDELGRAGYDWWRRVVCVEHFNTLNQITGTLVGTVGSLPVVAEGEAYTELEVGDSPETASFVKYGGYIPLTLELIDRDETRKLRAYPRELAAAGLRKISALVAAVFSSNDGIGPLMADGGALFNASAVTGAGGHANLRTTALSAAEWDAVGTAVYNQPMLVKNASGLYGAGPRMAVNPRYLLVPRELQLTAMKILYPGMENAANIFSENQQRGQPGDVITVPDWSDGENWAAACDPRIAPAVYVGERFGLMPEIFIAGENLSPAVFTHDEHRLKVRHFISVWVNDYRPLHKNNVA